MLGSFTCHGNFRQKVAPTLKGVFFRLHLNPARHGTIRTGKGLLFCSESGVTGGLLKVSTQRGHAAGAGALLLGTGRHERRVPEEQGPAAGRRRPGGIGAFGREQIMGPCLLLQGLMMHCLCCSKNKALLVSGSKVFSVCLYFYADIQI